MSCFSSSSGVISSEAGFSASGLTAAAAPAAAAPLTSRGSGRALTGVPGVPNLTCFFGVELGGRMAASVAAETLRSSTWKGCARKSCRLGSVRGLGCVNGMPSSIPRTDGVPRTGGAGLKWTVGAVLPVGLSRTSKTTLAGASGRLKSGPGALAGLSGNRATSPKSNGTVSKLSVGPGTEIAFNCFFSI